MGRKRKGVVNMLTNTRGKVRIQFDLDLDTVASLDRITDQLGATSRVETMRRALRLMDYVSRQPNSKVIVRLEDGTEEVIFVA